MGFSFDAPQVTSFNVLGLVWIIPEIMNLLGRMNMSRPCSKLYSKRYVRYFPLKNWNPTLEIVSNGVNLEFATGLIMGI